MPYRPRRPRRIRPAAPQRSGGARVAGTATALLLLTAAATGCGADAPKTPALDGSTTCEAFSALSDTDQTTAVTNAMSGKDLPMTQSEIDRTKQTVKNYCHKHDGATPIGNIFITQ